MNEIAHDLHTVIATALPKCPRCEALRRDISYYEGRDLPRAARNTRHRLSQHRADNDDEPCTERPQTDWKGKCEEALRIVHQMKNDWTAKLLEFAELESENEELKKRVEELGG